MPDEARSEWMTLAEVAAYIRLNRSKICEMAQRDEIPGVKVAGQWRFDHPTIERWIHAKSPHPASPGYKPSGDEGGRSS